LFLFRPSGTRQVSACVAHERRGITPLSLEMACRHLTDQLVGLRACTRGTH
jgi:hypothetical protein